MLFKNIQAYKADHATLDLTGNFIITRNRTGVRLQHCSSIRLAGIRATHVHNLKSKFIATWKAIRFIWLNKVDSADPRLDVNVS